MLDFSNEVALKEKGFEVSVGLQAVECTTAIIIEVKTLQSWKGVHMSHVLEALSMKMQNVIHFRSSIVALMHIFVTKAFEESFSYHRVVLFICLIN